MTADEMLSLRKGMTATIYVLDKAGTNMAAAGVSDRYQDSS